MPELPEIETIKRALGPRIVGRRIEAVEVLWAGTVRNPSSEDLRRGLIGRIVEALERRGKYLLFRLAGDGTLIFHLKMTGVLLLRSDADPPTLHTRAILRFEGGTALHFVDQRKFGRIWLVEREERVLGKLGPEPLGEGFSESVLRAVTRKRRLPIKALLCDQAAIAGIGNMWADEALFESGIHPQKAAGDLSEREVKALHRAIRAVLARGIERRGASVDTYRDPDGEPGAAQTEFRVAHRRGQSCPRCGSSLGYTKVRGRGTCFCPRCQKL